MDREEDNGASSSSVTTTTKLASSSESVESRPNSALSSVERVAENVTQESEAIEHQHNIGTSSNHSSNQQANTNDGLSGIGGRSQGSHSVNSNKKKMPNNIQNVGTGDEWDRLSREGLSHRRGSNSTGKKSRSSRSSSKKKKHRITPPAVIETRYLPSKGIMKKHKIEGDSRSEDSGDEGVDKIGELPTIMRRDSSLGSVSLILSNKSTSSSQISSSNLSSADSSSLSPINDAPYSNASAFENDESTMEEEREVAINFILDDPQEMTRSRRLALSLIQNKFYNPYAGKSVRHNTASLHESVSSPDQISSQKILPSLEKAWAYFEHVTLTRYIIHERNQNPEELNMWDRYKYAYTHSDELFERAQPGEKRLTTRLYDWISTPHVQLGDFGLGFGLYFSTVRVIRNILLIAGLFSAFNIYFFASSAYDSSSTDLSLLLKGSAVCSQTVWRPCRDCVCDEFLPSGTAQEWYRTTRCANATLSNGINMTFVQKNECLDEDPSKLLILGLTNYVVLVFLVISVYFLLDIHLDRETVLFDEDEQTAQDYSILVKNPPAYATDPEEWRQYFEDTFPGVKIVAVTCNVNNDLLIKSLVRRRVVLRRMELQLEHGTNMGIDDLALLAAEEQESRGKYLGPIKGFFSPGLPELLSKLVALNTSIKGLTQLSYPVTNVYVTFETESYKRIVMSKLSVGLKYIRNNDISILEDPKYAFRDTVLLVQEAPEPNSVRWQDLNADRSSKTKEHLLTTALSFASIYYCALIVRWANGLFPGIGAAFTISGLNLGYPQLAKFITDFESHSNESKVQTSLYLKIAVFRWVNTSIIITVITPFTNTLSPEIGLISQVSAIFFAEIVTTNVIQLTDVWGHIKRHILAPRAKTQDQMNRLFKGLEVELAERYTNMTKIMFLAFWYSSIFPAGLLFAAVALTVNYYTDRFSLMRSWQRAPSVGKEIATFSRQYFLSTACVVLAGMSSFYWAAFPFDNLCPTEEKYIGPDESLEIQPDQDDKSDRRKINLANDTNIFRFCNQDFILSREGPVRFPFVHRDVKDHGEWMSEEQIILSKLFGWTSIGVMVLVFMKYMWGLQEKVKKQFHREYEDQAEDQGISFYDVRNIAAYVPQVRSPMFSYPLIVCSTRRLDEKLLDWTDPDLDYEYYDLTRDAEHVLTGGNGASRNCFDRVKYWPPDGSMVKELKQNKRRLEEKVRRRRGKNIFNTVSKRPGTKTLDRSLSTECDDSICPTCGTPSQTLIRSEDSSDTSDGDSIIEVS